MGLFNELTRRALDGVVGTETADIIANKLDRSSNPTINYYKNKVDNAFIQTSNKIQQNHPKLTQACNTAIQTFSDGDNEMNGNTLPAQYVQQEQPDNPIQQNQNQNSSNVVNPIDRSIWEFK